MQYKITKRKGSKKKAAILLILSLMLASLAGCGEASGQVTPPAAEPIVSEAPSDENADITPVDDGKNTEYNSAESNSSENNSAENNSQSPGSDSGQNSGGDSAPQNNFAPQSDTELDGSVKSIGEDSLVVSQSFTMPSENSEEGQLMVSPAEGSEDEVLVTVHVSENTRYRIHTVKNGGVNGDADVEKIDAGFGDIREKSSITAHGCYQNNDFWADEIIIRRYV